ncbi:MAG: 3-deoxy-manno-octulosonate cytidylyltransferase [Deltaproteobacteria bacterium]|nr:3-deoxy-manno-octulosonate cytidylyltransferase [Deltaproteobacteria bacterium]
MKTLGIVPARYASSRFPGKPLTPLLGKPMVIWVLEIAAQALGRECVLVATDDERIARVATSYDFKSILTSSTARTGTDRIWEVSTKLDADIYINIQGDEPLIQPKDIQAILEAKKQYPHSVVTGMCPLQENEDPKNVNLPKVITTEDLKMVYMSRAPLPATKDPKRASPIFWREVCIHAYSKPELARFGEYGRKSYLESFEDIEILRFLELGIPIQMIKIDGHSHAVDVVEDVAVVEALLQRRTV